MIYSLDQDYMKCFFFFFFDELARIFFYELILNQDDGFF
jgi:hypothetical protein